MYKLSEIISKKVISLFEAKNVGEICGVFFDERMQKIKYFEICRGENDVNKFVSPKNVVFPIFDAVCVKNLSVLQPPEVKYCFSPIGLACYDTFGKQIGVITDVCFENARVCAILAGDKSISPSEIIKLNDDILLVQADGKKYKPTPPTIRLDSDNLLSTFPPELTTLGEIYEKPIVELPTKLGMVSVTSLNQEYSFLIGKRLNKTLNVGRILREGTIISSEHVALAEHHGKIISLALYSE